MRIARVLVATLSILAFICQAAVLGPPALAGEVALDREEQALLDLINSYRAQNGAAPVILSESLTLAAKAHSKDMATNNYFSHVSLDGRTVVDRVHAVGYTYNTYLGECLAAGYSTGSAAFGGLKASPDHAAVLRDAVYKVAGIGLSYNSSSYYRWYWTIILGGHDDSAIKFVRLDLPAGWNMVSGPQGADLAGTLFRFSPSNGSYFNDPYTKAGIGYWTKYVQPTQLTLRYAAPPERQTAGLIPGWNLVGNITVRDLRVPPGYEARVWDPVERTYENTGVIPAGSAAWLFSDVSTSILLVP